MKKMLLVLVGLLFICFPAFSEDYHWHHTFDIISDPQGADIEVNGDYLGQTPTKYTVEYTDPINDEISLIIKAMPRAESQYVQTKYLVLKPHHAETMPKKVFFNMYLVPTNQAIDVNINKDQ